MQYISSMAGLGDFKLISDESYQGEKSISAVAAGIKIFMPVAGLVDLAKEKERLSKEHAQLEIEIGKIESRINSESFVVKAPAQVVAKEREKLATFKDKAAKIKERLEQLNP